jgi:uncharacterized linocin/CFP29 family protein
MDGSVGNGSMAPILIPDVLNLGREKLPEWTPQIWSRIDEAAMGEIDRASVALQFLPRVPSINPSARTVPRSEIDRTPDEDSGQLNVDQTKVLPLLERSQLFFLSKEQYYEEKSIGTAATLANRSANRLARLMDTAIFTDSKGDNPSLVKIAGEQHEVEITPIDNDKPGVYAEKFFAGVAAAYSYLQGKNLYGPYALVVPPPKFADAWTPLKTTLITPAYPTQALMTAGFYASGTLPDDCGVMVSLGGTVDIAIAVHGATAFTLVEADETRRFRIYERFTVRIKVPESLVLLKFK